MDTSPLLRPDWTFHVTKQRASIQARAKDIRSLLHHFAISKAPEIQIIEPQQKVPGILGRKLANSALVGQRAPSWVTFAGGYVVSWYPFVILSLNGWFEVHPCSQVPTIWRIFLSSCLSESQKTSLQSCIYVIYTSISIGNTIHLRAVPRISAFPLLTKQ